MKSTYPFMFYHYYGDPKRIFSEIKGNLLCLYGCDHLGSLCWFICLSDIIR